MPIVDHSRVPETPWRPHYHMWMITGSNDGIDCTLHYSTVEPASGAPLHTHETDELIVILEGRMEARSGAERRTVGADHTLVIPKGMPHGFTSVGPGTARILTFFPRRDGMQGTKYLEGGPPEIFQR